MSMDERRLRILQILYERRNRPLRTIGVDELGVLLQVSPDALWGELRYLDDKGYVTISERQIGTRVIHFIQITTEGIDVAEGRQLAAKVLPRVEGASLSAPEMRIFISYAHRDNEFCYRLTSYLRDHLPD